VTSQIYNKSNNIKVGAVLQYLFSKSGPLATTGCDHGAFISTTGGGRCGRCHCPTCTCWRGWVQGLQPACWHGVQAVHGRSLGRAL
jgi:hypothetical protein